MKEGQTDGRKEGRTDGPMDGRKKRKADGRKEGRKKGRQDGRPEGRKDRRTDGRKEGQTEGLCGCLVNWVPRGAFLNSKRYLAELPCLREKDDDVRAFVWRQEGRSR